MVKSLSLEVATHLQNSTGVMVRNLMWIKARNRTTSAMEVLGIWNGDDVQTFDVEGEIRNYQGAGALIGLDTLKVSTGLVIRTLTAKANHVSPELIMLLRNYNAKLAPVEIHQVFFDPNTGNQIGEPFRVFKGWINKMPLKTGAKGGSGSLSIQMVSQTRMLTKKTAARRSNESQKKRLETDTFFQNVSISGSVSVPWGSKNVGYAGGSGGGYAGGSGGIGGSNDYNQF